VLDGLDRLSTEMVLVIEDVHQLRSDEALRGLEQLLARTPANLRVVLLSRRDPALGLHRLRLSGELAEIRAADLEFTAEEAGELLAAAGVAIDPGALGRLHERTEGWAAGLRLAAMSLARHTDPERFVAEFSGSERTVADYLLGEVLASLRPEVRDLLLRTCILERVSGPLADLLTGRSDGARLLAEVEEANALVVAVDVGRTWFRYHHLLADLLRLELAARRPTRSPRCTGALPAGTHGTAASSTPSATPSSARTGSWPASCSAATGQAELDVALDDLAANGDEFRTTGPEVQQGFWDGLRGGHHHRLTLRQTSLRPRRGGCCPPRRVRGYWRYSLMWPALDHISVTPSRQQPKAANTRTAVRIEPVKPLTTRHRTAATKGSQMRLLDQAARMA
jgi:LuxR family maltose regulon positive regulatory protein